MKFTAKKQNCYSIIFIMMSVLFFSCTGPKKLASAGKHTGQIDEEKFKGLFYDGLKNKILGNTNEAMGFFRQCLAINPASPSANFEISEIMEYDKRPDSSLTYISRAVNEDPENVWYKYFYAENLQELGRFKDVIKVYDDLIKMHPGTTDFYYKLALAQLQAGEYKEAIETYNSIEHTLGKVDEDVSMSKIEILEKIKDYTKAEEEIQKLIKSDPSTPQYYDMLGNLYELEGKNDKAFEEYRKMEEIYPHDPMVHLSLADYYKSKNQDQLAFEELEKAFDEPSLDIDTKIRIISGLATFTTGDSIFIQAMILSKKMVAANPTEPRAHAVYAQLLLHNKDLAEGRNQYRIAVSEDSSRYTYWSQLLDLEGQLSDIKDLETESKKAIGLFPNNPQLYYYNGYANMQLKNFDNALSAFKGGLFYVLNDSNLLDLFYANIGDASYYTRRFKASDSAYDEALKINPNYDYVLNNYSYYLSVRDTNLALAEKMSKRSNELDSTNDSYEDTYAWILYMSGKLQEAKKWENKAIQNGGEKDVTILEHYGDILFKLGEKDAAVDCWMKAKEKGANSDLLERKIKDKQLYEK
jgi:tetratricopeptide (TPR) repeat protein